MTSRRLTSLLAECWPSGLLLAFGLLCLRLEISSFGRGLPAAAPTGILAAGTAGLGYFAPEWALVVFSLSVPLLDGLGATGLLPVAVPASLVFSSLCLGLIARTGLGGGRRRQFGSSRAGLVLLSDILATIVLLSLGMQLRRHSGLEGFWRNFWLQSDPGFGSPYYFLTSAFLWLQGLFLFRLLLERAPPPGRWIKLVLLALGGWIVIFVGVQFLLGLPPPTEAAGFYFPVPTSPYEDIHSFGGVVAALLIFFVAAWPGRKDGPSPGNLSRLASALGIVVLLALVVSSWSRAAWLATGAALLLLAALRLRKRWVAIMVLSAAAAVGVFNAYAARTLAAPDRYKQNPYIYRLGSLTKLENLSAKDPSRIRLYEKALAMIRERPVLGHGIGSFYLTSTRYARADDELGALPNFAHDFMLQFAAELGLPAALLLAGLVAVALGLGFIAIRKEYLRPATAPGHHLRAGLTLALTAYLVTQLTANAVNVYLSNQFFFWLLLAALVGSTTGGSAGETGETLPGRDPSLPSG